MINILDLFSAHFGPIFDPVEPGINILDLDSYTSDFSRAGSTMARIHSLGDSGDELLPHTP